MNFIEFNSYSKTIVLTFLRNCLSTIQAKKQNVRQMNLLLLDLLLAQVSDILYFFYLIIFTSEHNFISMIIMSSKRIAIETHYLIFFIP